VRALNDLFYRLNAAFATQRTFIADAAHSLKTPLAVLRIQLEHARNAGNDNDRALALEALSQGIERASRLVQQLLTLAKQEPNAPPGEAAQTVALDAVLREIVAEAVPLAQTRDIDLGVAEAQPIHLSIDLVGVRALLANLVDNAVRYSHPGGRIDASIAVEGSGARIEIIDDGPGIPLEERTRVFDRFYRGADAAGTGRGLGLAIAAEIAHRHGGNISLENGFAASAGGQVRTGLKVVVRLGELKR
jgi:two-component system OmpR family sensor kinase